MEITWTSSPKCDYCGKEADVMYDAETRMGPWSFMCPGCWKKHGFARLGTGFGQKYEKDVAGRLVKTEG